MAYQFVLGVDARSIDGDESAAISIVEKEKEGAGADHAYRLHRLTRRPADPEALTNHVQDLIAEKPFIGRTAVIVTRNDEIGQSVFDALDERGLAPVGATLSKGTGGAPGDRSDMNITVGVKGAIDALAELKQQGRFDASPVQESDALSDLVRAIRTFTDTSAEETGADQRADHATSPSDGTYDPLLMSTAVACWFSREQTFDPTQRLKDEMEGIQQSKDAIE